MNSTKKVKVCRVCLDLSTNYEPIVSGTKEIFISLELDPNLNASDDPVICDDCTQHLTQVVDFKSMYLNMQDCIRSFAANKGAPLDLKRVCQIWWGEDREIDVPENCTVCRFCMELREVKSSIPLRKDNHGMREVKSMLEECGLQIDLNITTDPTICHLCQEFLQMHVHLIKVISDVEQQIWNYRKLIGMDDESRIDLMDVFRFVRGEFQRPSKNYRKVEFSTDTNLKEEELDENFFIKCEETDVE